MGEVGVGEEPFDQRPDQSVRQARVLLQHIVGQAIVHADFGSLGHRRETGPTEELAIVRDGFPFGKSEIGLILQG